MSNKRFKETKLLLSLPFQDSLFLQAKIYTSGSFINSARICSFIIMRQMCAWLGNIYTFVLGMNMQMRKTYPESKVLTLL